MWRSSRECVSIEGGILCEVYATTTFQCVILCAQDSACHKLNKCVMDHDKTDMLQAIHPIRCHMHRYMKITWSYTATRCAKMALVKAANLGGPRAFRSNLKQLFFNKARWYVLDHSRDRCCRVLLPSRRK